AHGCEHRRGGESQRRRIANGDAGTNLALNAAAMSMDLAHSSPSRTARAGRAALVVLPVALACLVLAPSLARAGATERARSDRVLAEGGDWLVKRSEERRGGEERR